MIFQAFDGALQPMMKKLIFKSEKSQLTYIAESRNGRPDHKMGHLACFAGGLLALASKDAGDYGAEYLKVGAGITNTCHEGYARSASKIGPETMYFSGSQEATCNRVRLRALLCAHGG